MIFGVIKEGPLEGKRIIIEPRKGLKQNEYFVEKGSFLNGTAQFSKACLLCGKFIPDSGCIQHEG
jgi:hypothetical protein